MAEQVQKKSASLWRRLLKAIGLTLLTAVVLAAFFLAAILGQPQEAEDAVTVDQTQPLLTASPAVRVTAEQELAQLAAGFPVPLMGMVSGSGLTFASGMAYDTTFEGGFARIASLVWRAPSGQEITVTSIYPARALSLLGKGDYHLVAKEGQKLAGMRSVRMESATMLRLHVQATDALYAITLPLVTDGELRQMTQSLQLFTQGGA